MKLNELIEIYGEYELKDGFMDFLEAPKPKTVWDLEYGNYYYCIRDSGIHYSLWVDARVDDLRRSVGNCYLTKEEAEFALEQKKIITELKRLGGTEDMMSLGDRDKLKYCIRYLHDVKKLEVLGLYLIDFNFSIFFATKEDAMNAIKEIGEDRIKKYLFYVKEGETK